MTERAHVPRRVNVIFEQMDSRERGNELGAIKWDPRQHLRLLQPLHQFQQVALFEALR